MAVLTSHVTNEYFGLRPMDPLKDLRGVAELIEEAFANDLDQSGQNALQELRWLSRMKPVLWWMVYANPDHADFLSGFVWEEDRKIVGNITINRTSIGSRRWLISNLAVSEKYRRRGIAKGLMYAAFDLVKDYHGTVVALQVRADNKYARQLYEDLQFKEISGTTYLHAKSVSNTNPLPQLPQSVVLRPRKFDIDDARAAYTLACASTPPPIQTEWPIRQRHFRLGSGDFVGNNFRWLRGGGPYAYWVVEDGQRFVAMIEIYPGTWRKNHRVNLTVHPDWRGLLEKPLISRALVYLYKWPNRNIAVRQPSYHVEAVNAYRSFGLKETQTLIWMKRKM